MDLYRFDDWKKKTIRLVKREPYESLFETSLDDWLKELEQGENIIGQAKKQFHQWNLSQGSNDKKFDRWDSILIDESYRVIEYNEHN